MLAPILGCVLAGFLPAIGLAAEGAAIVESHPAYSEPHVDWAAYGLLWAVPFAGLLLSIAVMPLMAPRLWHNHFGKVSAFWALAFLVPFGLRAGLAETAFEITHTALLEYFPFIILLFALYTVSGGVRLRGALPCSPTVNTGLLGLGTGIASLMGTTGAAMLLIRPLLQANEGRRHNVHVVVFFIFLVANIGGSLTPLGDPPLFLGFLKGVDFFWPTRHLLAPMLFVSALLLAVFFMIDSYFFQKEGVPVAAGAMPKEGLAVEGIPNIVLLACIVGAVLLSGLWRPEIVLRVYHVPVELQDLVRDGLLVAIAGLSMRLTSGESRKAIAFSWFPIIEVAKLFAAIFVTIIPAIGILRAGEHGVMAPLVDALSTNGAPNDHIYFWVTGTLSSFLDNAPTYLVFFNTAGGDPQALMGPFKSTLLAISMGAVFMGAMTYIGNAPNFMVRSIAAERGIAMPSFFGYMLWSCSLLIPAFVLVTVIFL